MEDLIYIIACALNKCVPDEGIMENMDLDRLYRSARAHYLTAMAAMVIENTEKYRALSDEDKKKWEDGKNKAIRKNMLLDEERRRLCDFMESEGIWYMPLKGSVLKEYYPRYGMRQMSDNDILFDEKYAEKVRDYMLSQGYVSEHFGRSNHDVYKKKPVYNFEMHRRLYEKFKSEACDTYYENIKDRLVLKSGKKYEYVFTKEDFYVYVTSHTYKHYSSGGTGLRSVVDAFVYVSGEGEKLDWDYMRGEFEKLGMAEFEEDLRKLAIALFEKPDYPEKNKLSEKQCEMISYIDSSGVYGTVSHSVENSIENIKKEKNNKKSVKLNYILYRLNPDELWWKANYPFCAKHHWAKPFCTVFRIVRMVTVRNRKFRAEFKTLKNYSEKD